MCIFQVEIVGKKIQRDDHSKITVQGVKDFLLVLKEQNSDKKQLRNANLNRIETTLSTQLKPEQYNRLMKFVRGITNPDSSSEEIENSLVNSKLTQKIV